MLPFSAVLPMDVQQHGFVQMRVEQRLRSGNDIKAVETELNPQLRYDALWKGGQNVFAAIYQPRFLYTSSFDRRLPPQELVNRQTINLRDPNSTPFSALHNGGFGIEMNRARWRLTLYQYAGYGTIATTALLAPPVWEGGVPPPDPNPIIPSTIGARFTLIFVQTQAFLPLRLTARTALIPGFTYNVFGGADKDSRAVIALTTGPGASLSLEHAATRDDRLITTVGAGQVNTTFQDEREGVVILRTEATQTWRHWMSANVSTELMGGGSVGGDRINGFSFYSLGHAALVYDSWQLLRIAPGAAPYGAPAGRGNRFQFGAIARVAPWIDLFSGDLEQRFVVSLAANYSVDRVTFRGLLAQARVLATPRSVAEYQVVYSDLGIRYRFGQTFSFDIGTRLVYQDFNNAVRFNQLSQATAYAGLLWAPLPARF